MFSRAIHQMLLKYSHMEMIVSSCMIIASKITILHHPHTHIGSALIVVPHRFVLLSSKMWCCTDEVLSYIHICCWNPTVFWNVLIPHWSPSTSLLIKRFNLKPMFTDHGFHLMSTAGVCTTGSQMQSTVCFFCCTWEPQDNPSLVWLRTCRCAEGNYGPRGSMQVAFEV